MEIEDSDLPFWEFTTCGTFTKSAANRLSVSRWLKAREERKPFFLTWSEQFTCLYHDELLKWGFDPVDFNFAEHTREMYDAMVTQTTSNGCHEQHGGIAEWPWAQGALNRIALRVVELLKAHEGERDNGAKVRRSEIPALSFLHYIAACLVDLMNNFPSLRMSDELAFVLVRLLNGRAPKIEKLIESNEFYEVVCCIYADSLAKESKWLSTREVADLIGGDHTTIQRISSREGFVEKVVQSYIVEKFGLHESRDFFPGPVFDEHGRVNTCRIKPEFYEVGLREVLQAKARAQHPTD